MTTMRAKMRVTGVVDQEGDNGKVAERVSFTAVAAGGYPADGSDENNSYAKWTPQADASFLIQNPALFGAFEVGQQFYVDFTKAE